MATNNIQICQNIKKSTNNIIIENNNIDNIIINNNNIINKNIINKKWKRFSEWINCICVVTFDLELGQAMEIIYPSHVKLSEQEKTNICYLAFPDSNSGCMGDTQFHIRLRVAPATDNTFLNDEHIKFNNQCIPIQKADSGHYWGFVYFRQTKDTTLPRGYFQKSLVLLTRLPFINLFYEICSLIAPLYFDDGDPVLETACECICNWPNLSPGDTITLPILGTVYQTILPKLNCKNYHPVISGQNTDTIVDTTTGTICLDNEKKNLIESVHAQLPPQVLSSVHEIDIFRSLFTILPHIHMLWELVITGEPIVVMGTSPTDCSHMVQSLTSLIAPLAYCAESRPYFTIHDSEFKEFTLRQQGPPSVILGVTNPFFAKTLQHWPHTIQICGNTMKQTKLRKLKTTSLKPLEATSGVYTQYKSFLSKDKSVIKKIMMGIKTKRPAAVQSALLRRHLLELTQSFMIPLERYMASLMPLQKDISPFKAAPNPNQFKQDDFLATIEQSGPQLTSTLKGDWEGLYKRFFRSSNFKGWYETRHTELTQTLQILQLQALSDTDLTKWAEGKHEIEIVDMILKLKQKLNICNETSTGIIQLNHDIKEQLIKHLETMKSSLPDDLKIILNNT